MTTLTFLGHGSFEVKTGSHLLLIDPFLTDNPAAAKSADEVEADFILITHGHFDHVADAVEIAKRTGATVIANFEIAAWFEKQGVENTHAQNIGGEFQHSFGGCKFTIAHHSSGLPDCSDGGDPCGFLLKVDDGTVYFAGDTGLFYDMTLIGEEGVDLAVLPIGDNFTMGPDDALRAVKLIGPKRVLPCHYNTWPPIEQDAAAWGRRVSTETKAEPVILDPGQSTELA